MSEHSWRHNKGKGYVSYAGQEIELENYEVLSGHNYQWLAAENGQVPPGAVKVGQNVDGKFLYAGRGDAGSLAVDKVHPSHGCLYIPYGSDEVKLFAYEVLSQRAAQCGCLGTHFGWGDPLCGTCSPL
ncbi:hypothetical protein ACLKA7_007155 [Drosophila subpalustris]